ncbi:hypothetical protein [Microbacterium sp. LTA6]
MNAAQRHHYDAIQQLARDEWPAEPLAEDSPAFIAAAGDETKQ